MAFSVVHGIRARGTPDGQNIGGPTNPPPGGNYLTNRNFAVIGDSLTERAFGSTPIYWQNGILGAPLKLIANSGFSGQSIFGLTSQIDFPFNQATAPGLLGLPPLGLVGVRIGTNTVRGAAGSTGIPLDDGNRTHYRTIMTKLKNYAEHVIVFPVPPIGGATIARNTAVAGYNSFLQSLVNEDPRLHWIDDCADLVDSNGNVRPQFFISDELHMNGPGSYQMALTAEAQLSSLLAQLYGPNWRQSRLATNPGDVFPATDNFTTNPTNVLGTGGTFGAGWSGQLPQGWRVETNGAGLSGVCSIVPAAVTDPNQVPWVRIKPSQSAAANISVTMTAAPRFIDANVPNPVEIMMEVRGNDFRNFNDLTTWIQAGGQRLTPNARLRWGETIGMNRTATLQQSHYRTGSSGGTALNYCYISGALSATGEMGSIDIRCWSVRG